MRAVFGVTDPQRREAMRDGLLAVLDRVRLAGRPSGYVPLVKELPHYRRFAARVARTDALLAAEIADRRADPELDSRDDILSMLVAAEFDDGSAMSDSELRDQLLTLLLAGHETTATALAWASTCSCTRRRRSSAWWPSSRPARRLPRRGDRRVAAGPPRRPDRPGACCASPRPSAVTSSRRGGVFAAIYMLTPTPRSIPTRSLSGPSASSMTARRPTPGSRSAAAPAGASAPRSPSSSCGSSCARS